MTTPRYEYIRLAFDWGDLARLNAFTMAGWKIIHVAEFSNRGVDPSLPHFALLERPIPSTDLAYPGRYQSPYAGPWTCQDCDSKGIGWEEAQQHYRDTTYCSGTVTHVITFDNPLPNWATGEK